MGRAEAQVDLMMPGIILYDLLPNAKEKEREERMVDAWAQGGEEGRGKLRKASGRCKRPLIRRYPNGGTRCVEDTSPVIQEQTQGTETS